VGRFQFNTHRCVDQSGFSYNSAGDFFSVLKGKQWYRTELMKISHFNDAYLSENLSRFVPRFVVILNQLFAEIQTKKTKPIAHHL
jgi:hypothetical protein